MTKELVRRLRNAEIGLAHTYDGSLYKVAADEIERLRATIQGALNELGDVPAEWKRRIVHVLAEGLSGPSGPAARAIEPFVVKHYAADERPTIKGNGFDGLEIGEDREEAQGFVDWLNARLADEPTEPYCYACMGDHVPGSIIGCVWRDCACSSSTPGLKERLDALMPEEPSVHPTTDPATAYTCGHPASARGLTGCLLCGATL